MTIDLPSCNLETCRFFFDYNCTNPKAYERCRYAHQFEWLINKKYEWISVKDRLPARTINTSFEVYSKPLFFVDSLGNLYIGDCYAPRGQNSLRWEGYDVEELADGFTYSNEACMKQVESVTHWMPLPSPPETK